MRTSLVRLVLGLCALALLAGGCQSSRKRDYDLTLARFLLEARPNESGTPIRLPQSGVQITVLTKPVIAEFDVVNVELVQVDLGKCLLFQLTPEAGRDLYRLTGSSQGRRLVLTLNGVALGARRIDGAWTDGTILMFVELPDADLELLVKNLKRTSTDIQKEADRR